MLPATTPLAEPTDTLVLPVLHTPPGVASESVILAPAHTLPGPDIGATKRVVLTFATMLDEPLVQPAIAAVTL